MRICITTRMRAKFMGFEMGSLLGMHLAGLCFQRAKPIAREYCKYEQGCETVRMRVV